MARIRTIKPEFWDSPGIEDLDPRWRLLYIAMWNWADDTGSGKAEARELMGFAFPRDEDMKVAEFRRGLGEVRRVFGVKFYKVEGRAYYNIPSWDKHQKIDKRSGSRWPLPESGEAFDPVTNSAPIQGTSGDSEEPAETPPNTRREVGAGTGEQGNRGTGEQGKKEHAQPTADAAEPDPAQIATKDAYERVGKAFKYVAVLAIAKWAIKERDTDPAYLADAFVNIYGMGKPITKQVLGQYLDGKLNQPQPRMDHSARGLAKGMAMMQAYDAQQEQTTFELEA